MHPETAQIYHTMGMALEMLDRFGEALKVQRKAVDIRRKTLGPHHQKVARSLNNYAITLKRSNQLDLAYTTLEEALDIKLRIWGPHHTSVGTTYQTMAGILKVQKKNEEVHMLPRAPFLTCFVCFSIRSCDNQDVFGRGRLLRFEIKSAYPKETDKSTDKFYWLVCNRL